MKHIAAALLLALGGRDINESNMNEVLASVGVKPVPSVVKTVVESCKGKKVEQLIAEGLPKLAGSIGGGAGSGAATATPAADAGAAKKEEPKKGADAKGGKKEEKKPEPPKEEEEAGLGDLFF